MFCFLHCCFLQISQCGCSHLNFFSCPLSHGQGACCGFCSPSPFFLAGKSLGPESVLPLDLGLELPGCGVFRPLSQFQTREREESRTEGRKEGQRKENPSVLTPHRPPRPPPAAFRKDSEVDVFSHTEYKPGYAQHPRGSLQTAGQSLGSLYQGTRGHPSPAYLSLYFLPRLASELEL